jgi:endonuclease YncB( thermonuclease family)
MVRGIGPNTAVLAGLAGILVWSGLMIAASRHVADGDSGIGGLVLETPDIADLPQAPGASMPEADAATPPPVATAPPGSGGPSQAAQPQVRAVQPDVFAYPVKPGTVPLERIAARAPAVPKDVAIVQIRTLPVPRPFTVEAGLIAVGRGTLQIDGIRPTALSRQCDSSSGTPWPCGIIARTHQRMFFRNRTLDCTLDSLTWQGTRVAACTLVGKSVGEWLVENGWAEAEAGSPLADKAKRAMDARLGLFGDDPR